MLQEEHLAYSPPRTGGSLLVAFSGGAGQAVDRPTCLIVGGGTIAATRAVAALEADMRAVVMCSNTAICDELRYRALYQQVQMLAFDDDDSDFERALTEHRPILVCVTDTALSLKSCRRSAESASALRRLCRLYGVPVNVTDMPLLCDFTFLSTHRTGNFQFGVTTNGRGCRIAGRIRRQIVASLPTTLDKAISNIGTLRDMARAADEQVDHGDAETESEQIHDADAARRRMAWIAQMSEYWPIDKLAALSQGELTALLAQTPTAVPNAAGGSGVATSIVANIQDTENTQATASIATTTSLHDLEVAAPRGQVFLVGSGPGHPSLLTVAAHRLLTSASTHAILSDKLVPSAVLELIPSTTQLHIARKFPGNADRAQDELTALGIGLLREGKSIVRLKQGDPCVFGRAGEEILAYRAAGFEPTVVPGLSAALAGPSLARPPIPVTQRGVADSLAICTGVGRGGAAASLPGYQRARTTCLLMAAARVSSLVEDMTAADCERRGDGNGAAYPGYLPVALLERATMPDQRVLCTTLEHLEEAMSSLGEARPPGMLVVGWTVLSMDREGHVDILERGTADEVETRDRETVHQWLDGQRWKVVEGLDPSWIGL
ncbi:tetrapyrrole methylase [Auriculariales sp. MPI-PUGE-AT-0066]|nr:tetrapyrrole methylase [Auriculariales sp. MPI-PUGE-AT-0066]